MATLTVGTGQQYATLAGAIAASSDGDVLRVQAGTYTNDFATINTKITIQGVGGMVQLLATVAPPNGKAILVTNTDVTIDHVEFSGTKVADMNGAGIRYQGGSLTITNSYFHDNQNGILGGPSIAGTGVITISNSEFAHNGAGDGYSHNLYVGDVASLAIDQCYFHDAVVGHEIKSRAEKTTITNSRIFDGLTGIASYSIDLPNGGNVLIQNNVIEQGPNSQNPAIIAYGEEGSLRASSALSVAGNTILNDLTSSSASAVWNAASTVTAIVTSNAFYGLTASQIVNGLASVSGSTMLTAEPVLNTSSPVIPAATTTTTGQVITLTDSAATITISNSIINATSGDHSLTLYGTSDVVTLTGGRETVTALDGLNKITTGAGDDQVTISGHGSTVNTGAGANTITDKGDHNTIVIPPAGQGYASLYGAILTNGDVRAALAATTWDHSAATLGNYVTSQALNKGHDTGIYIHPTGSSASVAVAVLYGSGRITTASLLTHMQTT